MSARLEPMAALEPPVVASPVDAVPRVGDLRFLTRRRGGRRPHWTDIAAYAYLLLGVVLMFGPVLWLVISSFKTQAGLLEFPPNFLPMTQTEVRVPGFDRPLPLFKVTMEDGTVRVLAQVRRIGIVATMVDPAAPTEQMRVPIERRVPVRQVAIATSNYTEPLGSFAFGRYLWNSVFVTVVATVITLIINSMAAFALSIYEFPGRKAAMLAVIGTLMIPITVILVPVYLVVTSLGLVNSLWAVILPGAATPTGVFLLRQWTRPPSGRSTGASSCLSPRPRSPFSRSSR